MNENMSSRENEIDDIVDKLLGVDKAKDTVVVTEEILHHKLEVALELICQLYNNNNLITDAYIIGSVVTGIATKGDPDIVIVIINHSFKKLIEFNFLHLVYEQDSTYGKINYKKILPEMILSEYNENITKVIEFLENIGVRTMVIPLEHKGVYEPQIFQTYKGQLIEMWGESDAKAVKKLNEPFIRIERDKC